MMNFLAFLLVSTLPPSAQISDACYLMDKRTPACVREYRRHERAVWRLCGRDGANDDDGRNVTCDGPERRRYRKGYSK
jgi:hypothetical protein